MRSKRACIGCWFTLLFFAASCGDGPTAPSSTKPTPGTSSSDPVVDPRPVHVVLFTHIEDDTPVGSLGSAENRAAYLNWRADLIATAELARRVGVPWVLQPDWKLLEAARLYEDGAVRGTTGGQNVLQYLRNTLRVVIDPHSHEMGGCNYTDVAYLLDILGVGGSTVIGGHIWDPSLLEFAEWDRYRSPVAGMKYPEAFWRGDILMGAGTPGHRHDPIVSGVWHPRDRWNYFTDDPMGNMVAIGGFRHTVAGISELYELGTTGSVEAHCMLTASYHIKPSDIMTPATLATVERDVISPLAAMGAAGQVVFTDFANLVSAWQVAYDGRGCIYMQ